MPKSRLLKTYRGIAPVVSCQRWFGVRFVFLNVGYPATVRSTT
jgi:hypothetical protein